MKNSFFTNENQLSEWIEAAEGIRDRFGVNKAFGYLIGEKFYNIIHLIYSDRKIIKSIEEQRAKPDYNPIREDGEGKFKSTINLDETYEQLLKRGEMAKEVLLEFSGSLKKFFEQDEIEQYFNSNPRFGACGHTLSKKEHELLVRKGAIEHSLETEVTDALIYGEMIHYLL